MTTQQASEEATTDLHGTQPGRWGLEERQVANGNVRRVFVPDGAMDAIVTPFSLGEKAGDLVQGMDAGRRSRRRSAPVQPRRRAQGVVPTAVLLLVVEKEGHGYDLAGRLADLGFDPLDTGGLYRTLRALEGNGFLRSSWDDSSRGPARRVYQVTRSGRRHLACTIRSLLEEAQLLGCLVDRFRAVGQS